MNRMCVLHDKFSSFVRFKQSADETSLVNAVKLTKYYTHKRKGIRGKKYINRLPGVSDVTCHRCVGQSVGAADDYLKCMLPPVKQAVTIYT